MAPRKPSDLGERVASLAAGFEQFEKYSHERWHKLNNDLQPIVALPRDLSKLEGRLRGEMSAYAKSFEQAVSDAIEKAIEPINENISTLRADVDELKGWRRQQTGERGIIKAIAESPLVAWIFAAAVMLWAWLTAHGQVPK